MKIFLPLIVFWIALGGCSRRADTVSISGHVADFDGNPVDSCLVAVLYPDFTIACSTYSDKDGFYIISDVPKGRYIGMYAVRPVEYPSWSEAADEDMRLEFWAWNVLADKDLIIDPRYHRLELYGTVIFERSGGYPGVVIYTRPMSLGRFLSYGREDMAAEGADLSVEPDEIEFKVYAGGIPLTVRSIQPVEEYTGGGRQVAYLLYVDMPEMKREKYSIFRIEAFNRAHGGERGENLYFYEWPVYENKTDTDSDPIP